MKDLPMADKKQRICLTAVARYEGCYLAISTHVSNMPLKTRQTSMFTMFDSAEQTM